MMTVKRPNVYSVGNAPCVILNWQTNEGSEKKKA